MSVKGSHTVSDFLDFDNTLNKSIKMLKTKDRHYKVAFLILVGLNSGLRIGDLLKLRHKDIVGDKITLKEKKTGKYNEIKINNTIKENYEIYLKHLGAVGGDDFLFVSQKNSVYSARQVNRILKQLVGNKNKHISSHSIRKGFGRKVWESDNYSDRSLIILSKLFNHTSTQVTRTYLSIQQDELDCVYLNL